MNPVCKRIIADESNQEKTKSVAEDFLKKADVFLDSQSPLNDESCFIECDTMAKLMKYTKSTTETN